jgi:hypothetical protein
LNIDILYIIISAMQVPNVELFIANVKTLTVNNTNDSTISRITYMLREIMRIHAVASKMGVHTVHLDAHRRPIRVSVYTDKQSIIEAYPEHMIPLINQYNMCCTMGGIVSNVERNIMYNLAFRLIDRVFNEVLQNNFYFPMLCAFYDGEELYQKTAAFEFIDEFVRSFIRDGCHDCSFEFSERRKFAKIQYVMVHMRLLMRYRFNLCKDVVDCIVERYNNIITYGVPLMIPALANQVNNLS